MSDTNGKIVDKVGFTLVLLMALLQGFYATYAYVDPKSFLVVRGTELFAPEDVDWVRIYASRTMFVGLVIGFLLFIREYRILAWASLFGTVMPITDALLAYQAGAESVVVFRHLATVAYLLVTLFVLRSMVKRESCGARP